MKKSEILDPSSLYLDLARDLEVSLTSETGQTLNIIEFIQQEVDLGISLTRNQLIPLKIMYNIPLDLEDISVLEYWKASSKTTWDKPRESAPQVMVLESGRRCLVGATRIKTPGGGFITFNELNKHYFKDNEGDNLKATINLLIDRGNHNTLATELYRYIVNEITQVITDSTHIEGTSNHRVLVKTKGWVALKDLEIGDELETSKINPLNPEIVRSIKIKRFTTSIYVYDLHVPEGHYYIANDIISHNSGKSSIAALIAAYEFYFMSKLDSPQKYFKVATSTPIGILCLATTAEQAKKNIFRQVLQILRNSAYFKQLEKRRDIFLGKEEIAYESKGIYIQSGNSKSASQVGGTLKCFILDEASRFQDSDGESNALALWSNIGISCAPFGKAAKLVAISSAWFEGDAIQKMYENTFTNPYAVGFRLVSWDLNNNINKENPVVAQEYIDNPDKAALEYEGIRPSAVDAFLETNQIKYAFTGKSVSTVNKYADQANQIELIKLSIEEIESRRQQDTILHLDPAIKGDAYALAYGHSEFNEDREQIVVIDDILAWQPGYRQETSITNVGEVIRHIHRYRPLCKVTADHYNSAETIQRLREDGIRAEIVYFSNRQQLMMYTRLKSLLAEGKLVLPNNSQWTELLKRELTQVQLINNKKIDHPSGGCFVGNTKIPLFNGGVTTIAQLDGKETLVYSCDSQGRPQAGKAKGRYTKLTTSLIDIILDNNNVIRCTPDHLFMTIEGDYIQAKDITVKGTKLMPSTLGVSHHTAISKFQVNLKKEVAVYDLEVDVWSNFALLAGVYVHNSKDIADSIATVAYELSERVLIDNNYTRGTVGIVTANYEKPYEELSNRQKALTKLNYRKQWANEELTHESNRANKPPSRLIYPPYV